MPGKLLKKTQVLPIFEAPALDQIVAERSVDGTCPSGQVCPTSQPNVVAASKPDGTLGMGGWPAIAKGLGVGVGTLYG